MFRWYGEFVVRRAKLVLVVSALVMIGLGVLGAGAFGKLKAGGFADPVADSTAAARLVDERYGGRTNLVLLADAPGGSVDAADAREAGTALATALAADPAVTNVVSYWSTNAPPLKSADGRQALVLAHVTGDENAISDTTDALIEKYGGDRGAISVRAGGEAAANRDVSTEVTRSLAIAEAIAVPLTLLLLVLAFGSFVAAALPLAIGGVAILGTFAELFVLGSVTDVSIFAINLTTALGLGLGIDYALLLVGRFREQLAAGDEVGAAVVRTVETAGRTILFSAATVAAALAAMLVFPLFFLRSFGYAGIGVVAIAAIAALAVIPALLTVLGHRVNAGRVRIPGLSRTTVRSGESALWGRIAGFVMRRPAVAAVPVLAGLLLAASPLLGVSFGTPDQGVLPASAGSRQVAEELRSGFPGNDTAAIDVVLAGRPDGAELAGYAQTVGHLPGVLRVETLDPQRLAVVTSLAPKSDPAADLVRDIRALPGPGGVSTLVGGEDARQVDTTHAIATRLPLAALLIVASTFLLLFLFTGSVIQPIRALVLNVLSLSATIGILTWIFQDGHLAGLLGFTPRPMDTSMTVLMFCIAFGLSMDYEVFLTSRIKELHDSGAGNTDAVVRGLGRTGRIVSTAAGLLAVSFFAFGTSSVSFLQMFGIGSGLAILIDATLIRGVLVPAAMRLVGPRIWYAPRPLRRLSARLALSEA